MSKDNLVLEKESARIKALEEGTAIVKDFLTKPGGKFQYFEKHEKLNIKTGRLQHHVCGYTSGLLNVYIDSHNMEISIQGAVDNTRIMTSNQTMLAHPEVFREFLSEFQRHYEKLSVNAQRPKKH